MYVVDITHVLEAVITIYVCKYIYIYIYILQYYIYIVHDGNNNMYI